jgi:SAM-dependent MidA family methyltransferase
LSPLHQIISDEIHKTGAISFARFMELALYCPVYGYYEKEGDKVGRSGDFFTSVSVGNLFGELLAFQFAAWLEEIDQCARPASLHIAEAGAHDGQLAADILGWLAVNRPTLMRKLEYWILEPSEKRREWQQRTLQPFAGCVRWSHDVSDLEPETIAGVVFGNELLDAMPVHRFVWDGSTGEWFEWGVALKGDVFVWTRLPAPTCSDVPHVPEPLLDLLPDGFTAELPVVAINWWRRAAERLRRGWLVALDYGFTEEELFLPERSEGTLRTYKRHQSSRDVLAVPGEQDITAHVNFSAIRRTGEAADLRTVEFVPQEVFLTRIVERATRTPVGLGQWTPERARQLQTLVHPQHLGAAFRVLVQSKAPRL